MLSVYKTAFVLVAAVFSLFRGWYAVTILVTGGVKRTYLSERKLPPEQWHHWSWWAHEIFINFGGSLIGWAAAYYLIFCRGKIENLADVFLLLAAIAGIFGFLPWMLYKSTLK